MLTFYTLFFVLSDDIANVDLIVFCLGSFLDRRKVCEIYEQSHLLLKGTTNYHDPRER